MNRLNHQELAEVARLVARRGARAQGMGPTSQEVAAVLGLTPPEVEAMLHEIRLNNGGAPLANPAVERRTVLLSVGSVAALLIVAALALLRSVLSGGAPPAPVASGTAAAGPGVSASPAAPPTSSPLGSPAAPTRASAPLAQNSSDPWPAGTPPQVQNPGEARYVTSGSEVRRAIDTAEASAARPVAVTN